MSQMYELIPPSARTFVSKPWGWEDWIFNDEVANYCQKILFIKGGHGGSIHRHLVKDETLTCESGTLIVDLLDGNPTTLHRTGLDDMLAVNTVMVPPGFAIRLKPGTWHRLHAQHDTYVYEASTAHSDDDVSRVESWSDVIALEAQVS